MIALIQKLAKWIGAPSVKVGVVRFTLHLVDVNPTDGDLRVGLSVSWK